MFLCYVDESGTSLKDKDSNYFILASVCIHTTNWPGFYDKINSFKRNLISWAEPEDWELKGRDLRQAGKFFKGFSWEQRVQIFADLSEFLLELPCEIFAVGVNKEFLTEYVDNEALYRLGFTKLLEDINKFLIEQKSMGMLMMDARSDLHSSVQDRRLVNVYQDWCALSQNSRFIEMPWFGFSSFYMGLQLADYVAYSIEYMDMPGKKRKTGNNAVPPQAFGLLSQKVRYSEIP